MKYADPTSKKYKTHDNTLKHFFSLNHIFKVFFLGGSMGGRFFKVTPMTLRYPRYIYLYGVHARRNTHLKGIRVRFKPWGGRKESPPGPLPSWATGPLRGLCA